MKLIQQSLWIYIVKKSQYPDPSNLINVTYSWATVWIQWTFGDTTTVNVWHINKPVDPLKSIEYAYSVTSDKLEYEIVWIRESTISQNNLFIEKTYAAITIVNLMWNYNWIATKVSTGWKDYILALPSIVWSNLSNPDIQYITNNKFLVYNNYSNIPYNFSWSFISDNNFDFIPKKLVVFSWSIWDLSDPIKQIDLLINIQLAYSGAIMLSLNEQLQKIAELSIDSVNPTSKAKTLACNIVNFSIKYYVSCNNIDFLTFYIINVLHIDTSNIPWSTLNSVFQTTNWNLRFWTDGWVWYFDWTTWTIYNTWNSGLVSDLIVAIAQDTAWDMWFWTNNWISTFDWTTWTTINKQNSWLKHNNIQSIYTWVDWKIRIWSNSWLNTYDSWVWNEYKKNGNSSFNNVNAIFEDNLWNMWFWNNSQLDKYKDWVVTTYKTNDGLPSNKITFIFQDSNSNMWFWTDNWLAKYNWTNFTIKNVSNTSWGLPNNNITYIYQNASNWNLWFGTSNWATKFVEWTNTWTVYNTAASWLQKLSWNIVDNINQTENWDITILNNWGIDFVQ